LYQVRAWSKTSGVPWLLCLPISRDAVFSGLRMSKAQFIVIIPKEFIPVS